MAGHNFVTVARIATALNDKFGKNTATPIDGGAIKLKVPKDHDKQPVAFLAALHELDVAPEIAARVVINERTGTVVAGGDVRLLPAAIAQGGITISVSETPQIAQPNAFAAGQTQVVDQSQVNAMEEVPVPTMSYVAGAATLAEVAQALSTFGVSPRELASILQALRAAGALRAEILVQ